MITQVSDPVWIPSRREWEIIYTVKDNTIGEYKQRVWAETLVSAERVVALVKEKMR